MNTYCITYLADFGSKAEYWIHASSKEEAKIIFLRESRMGNLDYQCLDEESIEINQI